MTRPHCRINCCISTKIRSDYLWKFGSNTKKHQINRKWATRTRYGNIICFQRKEKTCLFATIGLSKPDTRKLYTDLTGCLPLNSNRGMKYMVILYAYDTNEIFVEPIKTRSYADMLRGHYVLYNTSENAVHALKLNMMDNESSAAFNWLLQKIRTASQLRHRIATEEMQRNVLYAHSIIFLWQD